VIYICAALILLLAYRELVRDNQRKTETVEARVERKQLLDRIQHPEIRQVEPGEPVERDEPKDAAELAQVGQIVPDGVMVGEYTDG
jgi:hypothetical protein